MMSTKKINTFATCLLTCAILTSHCFAIPASALWGKLQPQSSDTLTNLLGKTNDPIESAWLRLALISKEQSNDTEKLVTALLDWRDQNPSHPGNELLPTNATLSELVSSEAPQRIAVLLPESGPYATAAEAIHKGIMSAYDANNGSTKKQRIKFYDTAGSRKMAATYKLAIDEGADFIIGPLTKTDVKTLNANAPFPIPVLALNYTPTNNINDHYYEFGLLPEDDAVQIARRAHQANLSRALVIISNSAWGKRLNAAFESEWNQLGGKIQENWYFLPKTDFSNAIANLLGVNLDIDKKLSKIKNNRNAQLQQRRQDIDVIILFAQAKEANLIVPLLKFYYAGNIPVYATSTVIANKSSVFNNHDLNGVIVCDAPQHAQTNSKLYAIGQDAYRLSQSITRLSALPQFPIYSASGALILDNNHQIHRHLPCFAINDTHQGLDRYASNN